MVAEEENVVVGYSSHEILKARQGKPAPTGAKVPERPSGQGSSVEGHGLRHRQAALKRVQATPKQPFVTSRPEATEYGVTKRSQQLKAFIEQKNKVSNQAPQKSASLGNLGSTREIMRARNQTHRAHDSTFV